MSVPNSAPGGDDSPMANGRNVRARVPQLNQAQSYLPGAADAEAAGKFIESIQKNNSNLDDGEQGDLKGWVASQAEIYDEYRKQAKGDSTLDLGSWLAANASDFLRKLDEDRKKRTASSVQESWDRRVAAVQGGWKLPNAPDKGRDDLDIVTIGGDSLPPKGPPSEAERAVQSFRAETAHVRGIDPWIRDQLKAYTAFIDSVGRKNSTMTAEQWLKVNFRNERGMIR